MLKKSTEQIWYNLTSNKSKELLESLEEIRICYWIDYIKQFKEDERRREKENNR